jgi:fucose permease
MAALILLSTLPEIEAKEEPVSGEEHKRKSLFQFPYFWYGVLALFFYVGAEVLSVDGQIKYGLALGFDIKVAKFFSSFTLIAMLVGYLVGIISIPKYISQQKALKYFALLGIFFTIMAVFTKGYVSILSIAALGFANSIMWPAIWPLAIDGLGKFTKLASAILVMAIAGGALIPLFYGYLSGLPNIGPTHAYAILVICYLVIFYFATYAYKIGKRTN